MQRIFSQWPILTPIMKLNVEIENFKLKMVNSEKLWIGRGMGCIEAWQKRNCLSNMAQWVVLTIFLEATLFNEFSVSQALTADRTMPSTYILCQMIITFQKKLAKCDLSGVEWLHITVEGRGTVMTVSPVSVCLDITIGYVQIFVSFLWTKTFCCISFVKLRKISQHHHARPIAAKVHAVIFNHVHL